MKHFPTPVKLFVNLFLNIFTSCLTPFTAENARRCRRGAHYIDSKPPVNTLRTLFLTTQEKHLIDRLVHHFKNIQFTYTNRALETNRISLTGFQQRTSQG